MKTHSRKSGHSSSVKATEKKRFNSTTSAAAVNITRFGQATFTSVRRQDCENGNGNYVPLKKAKLDSGEVEKALATVAPVVAKPKVYKFFKSRAPAPASNETAVSKSTPANCATSKSLMLNTYSKQDGVKRITASANKSYQATYSRIKSEKNPINSSSASKSLADKKSCEIKVCGDKTIKKVISPTKTTEFIIRNNLNVRNATVKTVTTPTQILQTNRGIRASRRLKGIEPEPPVQSVRAGTTVHVDYEKEKRSEIDDEEKMDTSNFEEPNVSKSTLSTSIEVANDEESSNADDSMDQNESLTIDEPEMSKDNDSIVEENDDESPDGEFETLKDEEKDPEENPEEQENDNPEEINDDSQTDSQIADQMDNAVEEMASENPGIVSESNSGDNNGADNLEPEKETKIENNDKVLAVKPKKKIFSNRDRSKAKFNTQSFFASNTKDEFDMDIDEKANSASQPTNNEKSSQENVDDDVYLKLKRVKKAHQCHELGETEQFDEDIKYYLSGIVSSNPKSMRCLSILGLSQQAMRPEFRMHLRAHDDMPRIIKALMDAPQDSNLALCTATLMFVYNQDRMTMDIDPNALSLMLELLETRLDECNQVEEKHRTKIVSLVEEMKNKGHAEYLKLNEITAGKLAMETLLGLTSKRAGSWFKDELRRLKGIDYIMNTVLRCAEDYSAEGHMVKIDRCMHVLENVTFDNVDNQLYITKYNESKFISTCITLLKICKQKIIASNDSKVFLTAFFSILRVLTNLTSESVSGCEVVGTFDGIIELLLESLFELPSFIMSDQRFDMMVIILCLCINLVEFCQDIRKIVINSESYVTKLTELLFSKIEEADMVEQQTDHLLESHKTVQMTEAMQDNLLMQMISKSGTHMEHSLISACVCLLFGCCIQDNEDYMNILKEALPKNSFDPLIGELEKLRDFSHLADIMTQKGKDRVQRVLQLFKMYK